MSMEDLVTDLLSNPVDVADWVPEWVTQEAARRAAAGEAGDDSGSSLKAHIGIVSSATAILKDMEDRGLLKVGGWGCGLRMGCGVVWGRVWLWRLGRMMLGQGWQPAAALGPAYLSQQPWPS